MTSDRKLDGVNGIWFNEADLISKDAIRDLTVVKIRDALGIFDRPAKIDPLLIPHYFYESLTPLERADYLPKNFVIAQAIVTPKDTIVARATDKSSHSVAHYAVDPQKSDV